MLENQFILDFFKVVAMKLKAQAGKTSSVSEVSHQVCETGQLRRAKMHAAEVDNKNVLTPALRKLVEASFILGTTNTKILSAYLKRSPATIRTEFQRILALLGGNIK